MKYNIVLRQIALSTNNILDRKFTSISNNDIKIYKAYMKAKSECPTRAKAVMKNALKRKPIEHNLWYEYNKYKLEQNPSIQALVQKVQKLEIKQAKTLYVRNFLINSDRVQPSYVTRKLTSFQKIIMKIKMLHEFNDVTNFA